MKQPVQTQQHNNTTIKTPKQQARDVVNQYHRKFKKMDKLFASGVVRDGNNDVVGPFQTAQNCFYRGQVIPICAGWFGEIVKDFEENIKLVEREAASGDDGMTMSWLVNIDRKGGACHVILQQFNRAIGVAIVR